MTNNEIKSVEKIKSQYTAKETTKLDKLKELHKKTSRSAKIFSYVIGSVGALILGTGMCLAMGVIGAGTAPIIAVGVAIGVAGIGICASTYPSYKSKVEKVRKKNADKIIELSDEILNNNQ